MKLHMVGGKGANLGELSKVEGIMVPEGFCVTSKAYKKITENNKEFNSLLDKLSHLKVEDREKINEVGKKIRMTIESISISKDIAEEIVNYLLRFGENNGYAVRSSATAEDLPTASFAGQQDTYLNIIGKESILTHISKCWASLFTERAIVYRLQNGFDNRKVQMSVVVQKMIYPEVSGILFTADPVTSNRKVVSIDASFGLGEALVSGLVNADTYKVHDGRVIDKKIAIKKKAIYALKDGGTKEEEIGLDQQKKQALTDEQILLLEGIGRKIEEHFDCPQDIEWCLADNKVYIVQSRPITTLYPIPEGGETQEYHVYISAGHQQMMTDPMKPLGLSLWQLTAAGPMFKAGGRPYVDVTHMLFSVESREVLLNNMGQHDPLIKDALITIIERGDFIKSLPDNKNEQSYGKNTKRMSSADIHALVGNDWTMVSDLIKRGQRSIEELKQDIQTKSGSDLFDFIRKDLLKLKKILFDQESMAVIIAAQNACAWINEKMQEWLGDKNVADILSQSVPNNITSQMGLDLLDVADVIRPYPEVIEYLQETKNNNFLDELAKFDGGQEAQEAIISYLNKYGMRCSGEIER